MQRFWISRNISRVSKKHFNHDSHLLYGRSQEADIAILSEAAAYLPNRKTPVTFVAGIETPKDATVKAQDSVALRTYSSPHIGRAYRKSPRSLAWNRSNVLQVQEKLCHQFRWFYLGSWLCSETPFSSQPTHSVPGHSRLSWHDRRAPQCWRNTGTRVSEELYSDLASGFASTRNGTKSNCKAYTGSMHRSWFRYCQSFAVVSVWNLSRGKSLLWRNSLLTMLMLLLDRRWTVRLSLHDSVSWLWPLETEPSKLSLFPILMVFDQNQKGKVARVKQGSHSIIRYMVGTTFI